MHVKGGFSYGLSVYQSGLACMLRRSTKSIEELQLQSRRRKLLIEPAGLWSVGPKSKNALWDQSLGHRGGDVT